MHKKVEASIPRCLTLLYSALSPYSEGLLRPCSAPAHTHTLGVFSSNPVYTSPFPSTPSDGRKHGGCEVVQPVLLCVCYVCRVTRTSTALGCLWQHVPGLQLLVDHMDHMEPLSQALPETQESQRGCCQLAPKAREKHEKQPTVCPIFLTPRLGYLSFPVSLNASSPLHWTPLSLYFISSQTEDWGYLNEDGELGLAYQGLKQVARSNMLPSCLCFLCVPARVYVPWFGLSSCERVWGTVHIGFRPAVPRGNHLLFWVWAVQNLFAWVKMVVLGGPGEP